MTNRFMVSAAALALLAGTGFANAQGMGKEPGGAAGGSTMQQHSAPGGSSAGSTSQSEQKQPGAMKNNRAEDTVKGGSTREHAEDRGKGGDTNRRAEENSKGNRPNERSQTTTGQGGREGQMNRSNEGRNEMNRSNERSQTTGQGAGHEGRTGTSEMNRSNERSQTEMNRPGERGSQTTGQAGAGAKLTSEQRTKITSVFRNERVTPENNVNFSIAVGSRVPRQGVSLHPLPSEVVTIYPEWRGYEFIRVHDQILVVDPNTYEIVAVLEA